MADRIGYAGGTTTGINEDITADLKTGTQLGSTGNLTIKKFQFTTVTTGGTDLYINDDDKNVAITLDEDAVGSGRFVFSTDHFDVAIKQVIVADTSIAWKATFTYA